MCALDAGGLREQLGRWARVGAGAAIERTPQELRLRLEKSVVADARAAVAVERECCPFFRIDLDERTRTLTIGVSEAEQRPALDAIAEALRR